MTRQRRLKRRIRARMARTGESYSTARRQVLRRLGNGAPVADQPEASEARRWHRARIGAVGLVLAVAVAGGAIVATQRSEGPTDRGPSTASTSENGHPVSTSQCRRLSDGLPRVLLRELQGLEAAGATPHDVVECLHQMAGPRWTEVMRDRARQVARSERTAVVPMRVSPPLSRRDCG
jgi:hypothetical protein